MREYALLKLRAADEEAATVKGFVRFYSSICQAARRAAHSAQIVEWLKRLDEEAPNLRAVLAHCLNGPDNPIGLYMVGSLGWYWAPRATSEGMYWLDLFLRRPPKGRTRAGVRAVRPGRRRRGAGGLGGGHVGTGGRRSQGTGGG